MILLVYITCMKKQNIKEIVVKFREENPDMGYVPMSLALGIPMSTIRYYLQKGGPQRQMEKMEVYRAKNKLKTSLDYRIKSFKKRSKTPIQKDFNYFDVLKKFGEKPKCYITGQVFEWNDTHLYHFDHIIPVSRGGSGELENLGIVAKNINSMKLDLTVEELIQKCIDIATYNGYLVVKKENGGLVTTSST